MFSLWYGEDYQNGIIRFITPTEGERLQGLPEGWTAYGHGGEPISDGLRFRALGNAIALPCAEYIMAGIAEVLRE
jgi:DNA (cytosine-5)-methyltransferase 1